MAHADRQGVVHRDVKPHNLIFDPQTRLVKILDFGLGRLVDEHRSGARLTQEGEILGTIHYLSPEQVADSREADIRSDIYSLGCVFFFLLSGFPPFRGKNPLEVLNKHQQEPRPPFVRCGPTFRRRSPGWWIECWRKTLPHGRSRLRKSWRL